MRLLLILIFTFVFFSMPAKAGSLTLWQSTQDTTWQQVRTTTVSGFGAPIAAGDLGSDGVDEIIVGAAVESAPTVRVLRSDGSEIFSFVAFDAKMMSGVSVAIGDVNGDGVKEIVAATGPGVIGEVRIFDNRGKQKGQSIFPFGQMFYGGLEIAVGDVNGDGIDETFAAPKFDRTMDVTELREDGKLLSVFAPFGASTAPVRLAMVDGDGDGRKELVVLSLQPTVLQMRMFTGPKLLQSLDVTYPRTSATSTVMVAVGQYNGTAALVLGEQSGGTASVMFLDGAGKVIRQSPLSVLAVSIASADFDAGNSLVVSSNDAQLATSPQAIRVDISSQRLTAYENGQPVRSFLVATGLPKFPTPTGNFSVLAKPYKVLYRRIYGPGNPENYDFGLVPYNLRVVNSGIYIHYAPWRKKFGLRGSHGCINVDLENIKWIYGWANVGTPVSIVN